MNAEGRIVIGYGKIVSMKIQNFEQLATTPERRALLDIAEAGLEAIDTGAVIRDTIRREGRCAHRSNGETDGLSKRLTGLFSSRSGNARRMPPWRRKIFWAITSRAASCSM